MGDHLQRQVQQRTEEVMENLDKDYLRKLKANTYRCAMECCEDSSGSREGVDRCVENCNEKAINIQQHIQKEFERIQLRLQRCVTDCTDNVQDKMGMDTSQRSKFVSEFESCAGNCVDAYVQRLPEFETSLKNFLRKTSKLDSVDNVF